MSDTIKNTFILRALNDYFDQVEKSMERAIVFTKSEDTGTLKKSLSHDAQGGDGSASGGLSFSDYGRYLDMGVSRAHPLGGVAATAAILKTNNQPRKRRKIYSKVAWGRLNGLIKELSYGYTQQTIEQIKNELTNV